MSDGGEEILARVKADAAAAMKAGDRQRAGALRMIADAVNQDARFGKGDAVAALQRERKKRIESAEAYEGGGRPESAADERLEAELIEGYLPSQLSDEELDEIVRAAIEETGASDPSQPGPVIGAVMGRVGGRADGRRVSQVVRERLGS